MTRLPEEECAFFFAAAGDAHARPSAGLCRAGRQHPGRLLAVLRARTWRRRPAIRAALVGLWVPPATEEVKASLAMGSCGAGVRTAIEADLVGRGGAVTPAVTPLPFSLPFTKPAKSFDFLAGVDWSF